MQGILQQQSYLLSDLPQPRLLGYLDLQSGFHRVDQNRIRRVLGLAHNDVAEQQNFNLPTQIDHLVHKLATRRTENHITLRIF